MKIKKITPSKKTKQKRPKQVSSYINNNSKKKKSTRIEFILLKKFVLLVLT